MKVALVIAAALTLTACAGANISSQARESGEPGSKKSTRCVDLVTGSGSAFNEKLKEYDGWKLIYVSEYTTPNKSNSAVVMCFERPL